MDAWTKIDSRYGRGLKIVAFSGTLEGFYKTYVTYWYTDGTSKSYQFKTRINFPRHLGL